MYKIGMYVNFTFSHSTALAIAWSPHSSTASEGPYHTEYSLNSHLRRWNWKVIPHRLSYQGVCNRVCFPPLQYPLRVIDGTN